MKKNINLDFCVLDNPLTKGEMPIIFVTRKGKNFLDASITQEEDYEKAIYTMQDLGYIESDILTFEFLKNTDFPHIQQKKIIEILKNKGMNYNEILEKNLINDFNYLKSNKETHELIQGLYESVKKKEQQTIAKILSKEYSEYRIPNVGEKISLYFYLFLECKFKNDNCYLNFNGDFFSKKETDKKNFIQITKCDFIRVNSPYNPNKIIFKSILNNGEILKKIPIFKNGSFIKRNADGVGKIFVYHIMEVKDSIPKQNRITIEIDNLINFDNLIQISKKIKQEQKLRLESYQNTVLHIESLIDCNDILNEKMTKLANNDEFEKAQKIKKDVEKIKDKISKLKKEPKKIKTKVIEKKYCIGGN